MNYCAVPRDGEELPVPNTGTLSVMKTNDGSPSTHHSRADDLAFQAMLAATVLAIAARGFDGEAGADAAEEIALNGASVRQ